MCTDGLLQQKRRHVQGAFEHDLELGDYDTFFIDVGDFVRSDDKIKVTVVTVSNRKQGLKKEISCEEQLDT